MEFGIRDLKSKTGYLVDFKLFSYLEKIL